VGADYGGDAAIEIPAESYFLRSRFSMKVDEDDFGLDLFQQRVGDAEGIVIGGHEDPSLQVDDGVGLSVGELTFVDSVPWSAGDVVRGPDEAAWPLVTFGGHGLHVVDDLAFIPYVIAGGENVRAEVEEILGDGRGNTEAAGGIFRIDDDQVHAALGDDVREVLTNDTPASTAEDVAYKKNPQNTFFSCI